MAICRTDRACCLADVLPPLPGSRIAVGQRRRVALTKVEVLVVVLVIGVLLALLLPARTHVNYEARIRVCRNNQGELAKAVLQYETAKLQLPGYIETIGQFPVSWGTVLLPYLMRSSLYGDWETWLRSGPQAARPSSLALAIHVDRFQCPSVPRGAALSPLSYVVNCGQPDDLSSSGPPDLAANGVFFSHDPRLPSQRLVAMTSKEIKDGPAYTLMLSENIQAGRWTDPFRDLDFSRSPTEQRPEYGYCFQSSSPSTGKPPLVEPLIGMVWFADANSPNVPGRRINDQAQVAGCELADFNYARPSSYHPGGVVVTFCDGHGEFLYETLDYRVYAQLMSSCDRDAKLP